MNLPCRHSTRFIAQCGICSLEYERDALQVRLAHEQANAEQYAFLSEQEKKDLRTENTRLREAAGRGLNYVLLFSLKQTERNEKAVDDFNYINNALRDNKDKK